MTINEVKKEFKNQYTAVEIYKSKVDKKYYKGFHTDYIEYVDDDVDEDTEVYDYELMDEDTYNYTIEANSCVIADFDDWYNNPKTKVLCILIV